MILFNLAKSSSLVAVSLFCSVFINCFTYSIMTMSFIRYHVHLTLSQYNNSSILTAMNCNPCVMLLYVKSSTFIGKSAWQYLYK